MRTKKRSDRIVMTKEAMLLRWLRDERGLSMGAAGALIGRSDSYIAHIETGRLDVPKGEKLRLLLQAYGMRPTAFYERLRGFDGSDPRAELTEIVKRMREKEIATLLAVAKGLVTWPNCRTNDKL